MRYVCVFVLLCMPVWAGNQHLGEEVYARLDIGGLGFERLEALKHAIGVRWWVELDDQLLIRTHEAVLPRLAREVAFQVVEVAVADRRLAVVSAGHGHGEAVIAGSQLAWGGRFAVVLLDDGLSAEDVFTHDFDGSTETGCQAAWMPFQPGAVLAHDLANSPPLPAQKRRAEVQTLVEAVDSARWLDDVTTLSGFSRVSGSEEIDEATRWLFDAFSQLPYTSVITQEFTFGTTLARNVIATLPGTQNPEDIYLVGAHYDSIASRDGGGNAPGAEDNGSGTAAVLEMARIFNVFRPHATVIFICYSGEEQGLFGSWHHVGTLLDAGLAGNIKAVCTMDMIGYTGDADLDVLLETGGAGLVTLDIWAQAAATYTSLSVSTSTNPFGSDHVPYIQNDLPALLTIENDWDSYPGYHRSSDTAEKVSADMGGEIIKMNVAALAGMFGFDGHDNPIGVLVPAGSD